MSFSNFLEEKTLDHVLGTTAYTMPTVRVALYTAAPDETGGGTQVVGGGYARQPVTFGAASAGAATNSATVTFTNMPAVTVTHFGLFDAVTTGNLLAYGALSAPVPVSSGQSAEFDVGALVVTLD